MPIGRRKVLIGALSGAPASRASAARRARFATRGAGACPSTTCTRPRSCSRLSRARRARRRRARRDRLFPARLPQRADAPDRRRVARRALPAARDVRRPRPLRGDSGYRSPQTNEALRHVIDRRREEQPPPDGPRDRRAAHEREDRPAARRGDRDAVGRRRLLRRVELRAHRHGRRSAPGSRRSPRSAKLPRHVRALPVLARPAFERAASVSHGLPSTRRKTIPGARVRTSLCAHGLGKTMRHERRTPENLRAEFTSRCSSQSRWSPIISHSRSRRCL